MNDNRFSCAAILLFWLAIPGLAQEPLPILFNQNFEGASLGRVEKLGDTTFRCYVEGQYDERGRNRQASWFYFRLDRVQGRDITLTLTDFIGEYNDKPGAVPVDAESFPMFSYNNRDWKHFPAMDWDNEKKEQTIRFKPEQDSIWIALQAPYTWSDLLKLLADLERSPHAVVEVIGKTAQNRDLHQVTVTNPKVPEVGKKTVWLQARQHAWESGTSFVMEGALRWVVSDDAKARALRDKVIFKFTPMLDPDGCATGKVRFNANGYDVNRHWNKVDLRHPELLRQMPEIWYAKKAILAHHAAQPIALMVNLHNTNTEFIDTEATDDASQAMFRKFFDTLVAQTHFDPTRKLGFRMNASSDANSLYREAKVPICLMELRTLKGPKLGRTVTYKDRLEYGAQLIRVMAETALEPK
ncbi:MAG: M14-type cytosolic carboxypeptidase [Verrucomicrobiota bacterium]